MSATSTTTPVGVVVKDQAGHRQGHRDAIGYHIDEEGILHIRSEKGGNIAAYARGCWTSVAFMAEG